MRANALVAKARVALARGDVGAALTELDAALADAPDHAPSLALAGELAFRRQDWPRARQLYNALERAPAVGDAISHEQLVQRRAALAHRTGDLAQAEALYRELAILSPQSVEARRALSELALARGDTTTATHRLEELLRMLPAGAVADVADLRHRLGAIYAETGRLAGRARRPRAGRRAGPRAHPRPRAAAAGLSTAGHARRGGRRVRAPGAPLQRSRAARGGAVPAGRNPSHAAGRRGRRAGRVPALVRRRPEVRSVAAPAGRALLVRGRPGRRRRPGRRSGRRAAVTGVPGGRRADCAAGDGGLGSARRDPAPLPVRRTPGAGRRGGARAGRGRRPRRGARAWTPSNRSWTRCWRGRGSGRAPRASRRWPRLSSRCCGTTPRARGRR